MEIWCLLITKKFLFWSFLEWEIRSFLEPKGWWKDDIYWLLEKSCFELFSDGKYGLFLSQEVDRKIIYTGYWEVHVLNFSVMGRTVFFSAKKLMERWYLLGLFELSMIFQDLGNMVFRAVILAAGTITRFSWNTKFFLKVLLVNSIKYHCGRKESIINKSDLHSNLKEKDIWSKSKLKDWITRKNQQGTKTLLRQGETF